MKTLWFDWETFSEKSLNSAGTYTYAENCEPMIATYAWDDEPVQAIDLTLGLAEDWWIIEDLFAKADRIIAHSAMFDRTVARLNTMYRYNTPIEKWRCCMVKALAHGFPGALGKACEILKIGEEDAKLVEDGKKLIHLFCKPTPKNWKIRRATRETHPEEWQRFIDYAVSDITAMRAVWNKLPSWNYGEEGIGRKELELWWHDQLVNDRGYRIDMDLVDGAIRAVDKEQARLRGRAVELTDGAVTSATKRDAVLNYLVEQHGLILDDLKGSTIERLLDAEYLDDGVKELLRVRLQASSTSTAKYKVLKRATSSDGKLHGTGQFAGAARTRRDAGRLFQHQNLPSRGLLPQDQIDIGIEALLAGCEDMLFENVMLLTTSTIRGTIVPEKGHKFCIADLSNIEGRGLAYLAGEEWKLQAFREFDTYLLDERGNRIPDGKGDFEREGPDLYKLAYSKSFRISPDAVTKDQRAVGKVQELALGYEGGVMAFVTFSLAYGIDLEELAEIAWPGLPGDTVSEAEDFLEWLAKTHGVVYPISQRAATVCEVFKRLWRAAHPNVVAFWRALKEGFTKAVMYPGRNFKAGLCVMRRDGAWLRIRLPSGRYLCYPSPQVADDGTLSYMGINQYNRKWCRIKTSGGKLAENVTQSGSRDVMFDAQGPIEDEGFAIKFRVHDELVTEVPDISAYSHEQLSALLATPPDWAPDLPLAAAGFDGYRYAK